MSAALIEPARDLGANTERLLGAAFAERLTISVAQAAALLDCDVKTLRAMTSEGLIRAVRRGKLPAYTEADVRDYLIKSPPACSRESPSPKRPAPKPGKVIPFSQRPGAPRHERL